MTPQEKDLITNIARKLKDSPNKPKDPEADQLINTEIGAQPDIVYKLTQAVLIQEMALKDLKQKNDYLQQSSEYYKDESQRGSLSKMFGGNKPAPMPPQPMQRQSGFGSFMQTAAGVAAGMVAGSLISNMLFDQDEPATDETAAAETPDDTASDTTTAAADNAPEASADAPADSADSGFLDTDSGFASDYTDSAFDNDFSSDSFTDDNLFTNNDDSFLGGGSDFSDSDFDSDDF